MPVDAKALLEAVSEGVDDANPTASNADTNEDTGTEDSDEIVDGQSDDSADDESDASNDSDASDSDDGGEAEGDEGDADPDAEGAADVTDAKGKKPVDTDKAAPAAPAAKKKDPINDPIPENTKHATKERIQNLIGIAKTVSAERDAAVQKNNEIMGFILETKATPQQYGEALDFLKTLNTGTRESTEQALAILQRGVAHLSKQLGKPVAGVDMLADHADLRAEVRDGLLSLDRANEIAAGRERSKMETQQSQQMSQQTQAQQAAQQELNSGREALNQLEVQLRAADPQYDQKREILVTSLKPVFAKIPPSDWAATFQAAYSQLNIAPVRAPVRSVSKIPNNLPVRAKQPAGGAVKAPNSLLDAISQGVAQAGGR